MKQLLFALALLQLPTYALCEVGVVNYTITGNALGPVPAKDARDLIWSTIYKKHTKAIDWWMHEIDAQIVKESISGYAFTSIDITIASSDVQLYLQNIYQQAGYTSEIMNNHEGYGRHHYGENSNEPLRYYLGLSW